MSVFILIFQGGFPLGSLLAGWLAGITSEAITVFAFACVILVVVGYIQLRFPFMRKYN